MLAIMTVAKHAFVDCTGESFEECQKKMPIPGLHPGSIKLESQGLRPRYRCFVLFGFVFYSPGDSDVQ